MNSWIHNFHQRNENKSTPVIAPYNLQWFLFPATCYEAENAIMCEMLIFQFVLKVFLHPKQISFSCSGSCCSSGSRSTWRFHFSIVSHTCDGCHLSLQLEQWVSSCGPCDHRLNTDHNVSWSGGRVWSTSVHWRITEPPRLIPNP